jgi:hypothetical protein
MTRWLMGLTVLAIVATRTLGGDPEPTRPACGKGGDSKDFATKCPQSKDCAAKDCTAGGGAALCQTGVFRFMIGLFPDCPLCAGCERLIARHARQCEGTSCPAPSACPACKSATAAGSECCEAKAAGYAADGCAAKPCPACADTKLYAELVAIIKETNSPDMFMVAVTGLTATDDHGRKAIPVVIRNAERIGVLKGIAKEHEPTPVQAALQGYLAACASREDAPPTPADVLTTVPPAVRVQVMPPGAFVPPPVPERAPVLMYVPVPPPPGHVLPPPVLGTGALSPPVPSDGGRTPLKATGLAAPKCKGCEAGTGTKETKPDEQK